MKIRGLLKWGEEGEEPKEPAENTTERTNQEHGIHTDSTTVSNEAGDSKQTTATATESNNVTYTNRFNGAILLLFVFFIAGLLTVHSGLIGASVIILLFIFIGSIQSPPDPTNTLTGEYTLTPTTPRPGESVTVTLTLHNTGNKTFTDIRIIDTVPDELEVTSTNARLITTLRPDEQTELTYTVTAKRGDFNFETCYIRTRSPLGTSMRDVVFNIQNPATLTCSINIEDTPLEDEATDFIGQLLGKNSGEGLEFDKTREYHRGDSPRRINWRALAKRGELSTIMFREQQAATVTIILDARTRSFISQREGAQSAPVIGAYAAYQLTSALGISNHSVNMITPGISSDTPTKNKYGYYEFENKTHRENTYKAFELIEDVECKETNVNNDAVLNNLHRSNSTDGLRNGGGRETVFDAFNGQEITVKEFTTDLKRWGEKSSQYIFITPLLDDAMHTVCQEIGSIENAVIIVPNPTVNGTTITTKAESNGSELSERLLATQQAIRIETLRNTGITVIDWNPKESLETACEKQTLINRKK